MPKQGDLRVWWIPNIARGKCLHVSVLSLSEAILLLESFNKYDKFVESVDKNISSRSLGDLGRLGGMNFYKDGKWNEWENSDGISLNDLVTEDGFRKPLWTVMREKIKEENQNAKTR